MILFKAIIFFMIPFMLCAKSNFVDSFALSGGDGSINAPFNSINEAMQNLNPGDTLYIRGTNSGDGQIYFGDLDLQKSGMKTAPIRVMNFENENVIVSIFSKFNLNQDYWSFEGIVFEDNNFVLPKIKALGKNNKFKNCIFRGRNLDNFEAVANNCNLLEYCKIYNLE